MKWLYNMYKGLVSLAHPRRLMNSVGFQREPATWDLAAGWNRHLTETMDWILLYSLLYQFLWERGWYGPSSRGHCWTFSYWIITVSASFQSSLFVESCGRLLVWQFYSGILLDCLLELGVEGTLLQWLNSFLSSYFSWERLHPWLNICGVA